MPQPVYPIRLHGPWQATVLRSDAGDDVHEDERDDLLVDAVDPSHRVDESGFEKLISEGASTKLTIPGNWHDWLGENFSGVVRHERNFGLPTNLADDQMVWLVIESVNQSAYVWLNGTPLGEMRLGQPPLRRPVRALLRNRNCLQIDVEFSGDRRRRSLAGGVTGEVRLEIVG